MNRCLLISLTCSLNMFHLWNYSLKLSVVIIALLCPRRYFKRGSQRAEQVPATGQFLPQDVAFSIHLSDNRFTARPLSTTVVSPPRKWAPWVDISSPQPASARFFAKWPLRACALYIPSLNNWQLTEVDGRAVKCVRRTVVEPLLKMYWHSDG